MVNPGQEIDSVEMRLLSRDQKPVNTGRILLRDAGFTPTLKGNWITLGPGQMAAVGFGKFSEAKYDLGVQRDVEVPVTIYPLAARFEAQGKNTIEATVAAPTAMDLRIVLQQRGSDGHLMRSWPGGPPNGTPFNKALTLHATQNGKDLPIEINYDKVIWSGLSWAVGEMRHNSMRPGQPITIRLTSTEKEAVPLDGHLYIVSYEPVKP